MTQSRPVTGRNGKVPGSEWEKATAVLVQACLQPQPRPEATGPRHPSRRWQQFFIKLKLPQLCFHCLRVTYVNRLRRAGVPREAAMRLVNHSSELIHQIYQREKVEDVMRWADAVAFPA